MGKKNLYQLSVFTVSGAGRNPVQESSEDTAPLPSTTQNQARTNVALHYYKPTSPAENGGPAFVTQDGEHRHQPSLKETLALQTYNATSPVREGPANGALQDGGTLPVFTSLSDLNSKGGRISVFENVWSRRFALLLTCLSASVGLGNVWRFPKVALEHGTGSFLVAYVVVVILLAQPLHFLELCMGQFRGQGQLKVWKCFPALKGLGYSQMVITFYLCLNLTLVMSWSFFYLTQAFREHLPWTDLELDHNGSLSNVSYLYGNSTDPVTSTTNVNLSITHWRNKVLQDPCPETPALSRINWGLSLCLVLVWVLVFLCLLPGIKALRKMTYVTCVLPFICLTALIVYILVYKGRKVNYQALLEMLNPKWEHLQNVEVWYAACQQAFISLNLAFGQLFLFSSFNEFEEHHVLRDSVIICSFDTLASLLSACTIFAIVGPSTGLADKWSLSETGYGISFVAYSHSIGSIDLVPQLWTCLFFLMIFFLGLGNVVFLSNSILYVFQERRSLWRKKNTIAFILCLICLASGLVFTTDASLDILTSLDSGIGFCVVLFAILETIGLAWGYGLKKLSNDLGYMFKSSLSVYWRAIWAFLIPVGLTVIMVWAHVQMGPNWMPVKSTWPFIFGWVSAAVPICCLPAGAILAFRRAGQYGFRDKLREIFNPEKYWGPSDPHHLRNWKLNNDTIKSKDVGKEKDKEGSKKMHTKIRPKLTIKSYENEGFQADTAL